MAQSTCNICGHDLSDPICEAHGIYCTWRGDQGESCEEGIHNDNWLDLVNGKFVCGAHRTWAIWTGSRAD